jgi:hypothetical protein
MPPCPPPLGQWPRRMELPPPLRLTVPPDWLITPRVLFQLPAMKLPPTVRVALSLMVRVPLPPPLTPLSAMYTWSAAKVEEPDRIRFPPAALIWPSELPVEVISIVPPPSLARTPEEEDWVKAAVTSRSVADVPSATFARKFVAESVRMLMRPAMVAVALPEVLSWVLPQVSGDPDVVLTPLLLCRVPPCMLTPPPMPQICISPAAVTVPPLILSVPRRWLCQPRPVPSPVVTTVPPEFTVSVPSRFPFPALA